MEARPSSFIEYIAAPDSSRTDQSSAMIRPPHAGTAALFLILLAATTSPLAASAISTYVQQRPAAAADSIVTLTVQVLRDSVAGPPLAGALVRSGGVGSRSDEAGVALLQLTPGPHEVTVTRFGYQPTSTRLSLRPRTDTTVTFVLSSQAAELEGVVVSSTRGERRVEDTPLRVEIIDEEEIAEKVAMSPGDISMMLAETGGLRVQATNPSLGGANVRIHGLHGRYSLILSDGLPLYGQAGGLGLLQIPPVDLGAVEIIKGTASALYGSSALGGVVNLVARRPGDEPDNTILVNQTTRGGTDGVYFGTGPMSTNWSYTLLAGAHLQQRNDLDSDGWTDMPGYERAIVRPRLYFDDGAGRTALITGGFTAEEREGGTIGNATVPGGGGYAEALRTRRGDVGGLARWLIAADGPMSGLRALHGSILTVRGSAMEQRHRHRFGAVRESDRHRTWFAEAALAVPRTYGDRSVTYVLGAAFQQDAYRNADLPGFDYTHDVPAVFAQVDVDPIHWMSVSTSARVDSHSEFGTHVNPRVSLLLHNTSPDVLADWTARFSAGTGMFAPTPFTEETEATGLTPLAPLSGLEAERARSASMDVGGPLETVLGDVELNATAFGSRVSRALRVREVSGTTPDGASHIMLVNSPAPTRTWGGELLLRLVRELGQGSPDEDGAEPPALRLTASYTYLRATECDPDAAIGTTGGCARREVPLTPRHALGMVAAVEQEGRSRIGLELYYTGRQSLEDNPYREESRPYLLVGMLGEYAIRTSAGVARVFLNFENITNVRQTRHDPLLLPARGPGGRWTTDAWTELTGFTINGGVRFQF